MKIMILTAPRSASNYYTQSIADQYGCINLGEPFPLTWGHTPAAKTRFRELYKQYFGPNNTVIKIHAGHISEYCPTRPTGWFRDMEKISDQIHVLVRKDTEAQIRSLFVASYAIEVHGESHTFHNNWDEPLVIVDTPRVRQLWSEIEIYVHSQLAGLSAMYHMLEKTPTVVWTEDITRPETAYKRPVHFEFTPEYSHHTFRNKHTDLEKLFPRDTQ